MSVAKTKRHQLLVAEYHSQSIPDLDLTGHQKKEQTCQTLRYE